MLGGSASSQTSGAPFRTDNETHGAGWPAPAHQNDLFNRGFGIYSLFSGPGDHAKTLYTAAAAAAKSVQTGTTFPGFLEPQKVPEPFFPAKLSFASSQFESTATPIIQPSVSRLDLVGKPSYGSNVTKMFPAIAPKQQGDDGGIGRRKESPLVDVVVIKSERLDEESKRVQADCRTKDENVVESDATSEGCKQPNEPDSTQNRTIAENRSVDDITSTAIVEAEKHSISSNEKDVAEKDNSRNGHFSYSQERCNNVVDLNLDVSTSVGGSKLNGEIKQCMKSKMPDSSCSKSVTVNCKQYNGEGSVTSKASPTGRMLQLPSNNGGCSRTTPVAFKPLPLTEPVEPKPGTGKVEPFNPVVSIKMEPVEFQKYPNGSPFLGFTPINNLFSPSALRVLDGQIINPVPYPEYSRRRENFISSPSFLSPQPELGSSSNGPYLTPKIDLGGFSNYKECQNSNYSTKMESASPEKNAVGVGGGILENGSSVNSTTSEDNKNIMSTGSVTNVTPCQVAEVTSASSLLSPKIQSANAFVVKEEAMLHASGSNVVSLEEKRDVSFTASGQSTAISSTVGTSLTRRCQPARLEEVKMSTLGSSSPPTILHRAVQSPGSISMSPAVGTTVYSGGLVCDDRFPGIWPAQPHNPGLWQYSAAIDYPAFPPVGFQLVRDPITGHFLLIPASNIEALQRAILWPSYAPTPSQMIIPPISLQPSTPHLLVDTGNVTAVDYLTPETLHRTTTPQHRILIPADNATAKKKVMGPALIKLENSEANISAAVTSFDAGSDYSNSTTSQKQENQTNFLQITNDGAVNLRSQIGSAVSSPIPVLPNTSNKCEPVESTIPSLPISESTKSTLEVKSEEGIERYQIELSNSRGKHKIIAKEEDVKSKLEEQEDDKRAVLKEIQKRKDAGMGRTSPKMLDVNIKKEMTSPTPSQVDLSGLELLSNSIERLMFEKSQMKKAETEKEVGDSVDVDRKELSNDACEGAVLLQNLKNRCWEAERETEYDANDSKGFCGLGLLCALAEQRFQEEIGKQKCKTEKVESKVDLKPPEEDEKQVDHEQSAIFQGIEGSCLQQNPMNCDFNKNYQNENEYLSDELKTKLNNEATCCERSESSYQQETQPQPEKRGPGRPKKVKLRKPSHVESIHRKSREMSPPVLERQTDFPLKQEEESDEEFDEDNRPHKTDVSKPPKLTPSAIIYPPSEKAQILNEYGKKTAKQETTFTGSADSKKRKCSDSFDNDTLSYKKRKVGRPKKHLLVVINESTPTETIVAKKPKTKTKTNHSIQSADNKMEGGVISFVDVSSDREKDNKTKKIKPKLKAEPKIREWSPIADEPNLEDWRREIKVDEDENFDKEDDDNNDVDGNDNEDGEVEKQEDEDEDENEEDDVDDCGDEGVENYLMNRKLNDPKRNSIKNSKLPSCVLTDEHIKSDRCPLRTLTAMGGLFYAGQLSAIRAPDVYGITIDGERGHRPHIYSREEILKDTILEVKPYKASDLVPGTRCCAYWSEQYRCLYPGTVSAPASPDPEFDEKFVNVEFDDGDSGKINIDDIRLLPSGYPIVEYDPNPLQSLSRRRRRISGASVESQSKDRKSLDSLTNDVEKADMGNDNDDSVGGKSNHESESMSQQKIDSDRKHLKKKRREKLKRLQSLSFEGKKKHKKRRCCDEHRHHKHHKKHRKHKHKHGLKKCSYKNSNQPEDESERKRKEKKLKRKSSDKITAGKPKKCKERTDSVESRSKIAAFLPARQLWGWSGKGFKRPGAKGRGRKEFYKTIQRGKERITVGDCAVFLSTGRPDRPYIGRIESMWESWGTNMIVKVKWFYHPEETVGCPATLEYPGALFESPHVDENDVQTISHKCEVLPLKEYMAKLENSPHRYETIYDNNDIYYLAGYYDPTNTTLKMEPGVK